MSLEETLAIFQRLADELLVSGAELVGNVKGLVVFDIEDFYWTLDLRTGNGSLAEGLPSTDEQVDLRLTINHANFAKMVAGKLSAEWAYLWRLLKVKGSLRMALKLEEFLEKANGTA